MKTYDRLTCLHSMNTPLSELTLTSFYTYPPQFFFTQCLYVEFRQLDFLVVRSEDYVGIALLITPVAPFGLLFSPGSHAGSPILGPYRLPQFIISLIGKAFFRCCFSQAFHLLSTTCRSIHIIQVYHQGLVFCTLKGI